MLGGGTCSSVFVRQEGVSDVLVEEVRVEGDHLIQLRVRIQIFPSTKASSIPSYLQELVDLPGSGRTSSEEEQGKRGGGRQRREGEALVRVVRQKSTIHPETGRLIGGHLSCSSPECHVVVHFHKVPGSFVQPTAGHLETKVSRRSLGKAFCVCCQGGKMIRRVVTVPVTVV